MGLHGEGIGGAIFLCLYIINFSILLFGFFTKRIRLGSVYALLLFHVTLRLAAQSVAVALGSRSDLSIGLLIAFFVLGAEGYFSLVLCSYRFLIHHHQEYYPISGSWLEGTRKKGKKAKEQADMWQRLKRAMTARDAEGNKDPWVMTIIHYTLIGANTVIIVGGTRVNSSDIDDADFWDQMNIARILRAVGQAIFLTINLFLAIFLYLTLKQDRSSSGTLPTGWTRFFRVKPDHGAADAEDRDESVRRRLDPILVVLMVAWPPLVIRGIFGLLQAVVAQVNYAHPDAYDASGFTNTFIVCENVLSVLPEWTACCLLCATIFTRSPMEAQARREDSEGMTRLEERKDSRASKNDQV